MTNLTEASRTLLRCDLAEESQFELHSSARRYGNLAATCIEGLNESELFDEMVAAREID